MKTLPLPSRFATYLFMNELIANLRYMQAICIYARVIFKSLPLPSTFTIHILTHYLFMNELIANLRCIQAIYIYGRVIFFPFLLSTLRKGT